MPNYSKPILPLNDAKLSINYVAYIADTYGPIEAGIAGKTLLSDLEPAHDSGPYPTSAPTLHVDGFVSIGKADPFGKVYPLHPPTLHIDGPVSIGVANPYDDTNTTEFNEPHPLLRVKDYVGSGNNSLQSTLAIIERRNYDREAPNNNPVLWIRGGFIGQTDEGPINNTFGSATTMDPYERVPKYIVIGTSPHETQDDNSATLDYSDPWHKKKPGGKKRPLKDMRKYIYDVADRAAALSPSNNSTLSHKKGDRYGVRMQWGRSMAALQLIDAQRQPGGVDTVLSWGSEIEDRLRFRFAGQRMGSTTNYPKAKRTGGFDVVTLYPIGIVKISGAIISHALGRVKRPPKSK